MQSGEKQIRGPHYRLKLGENMFSILKFLKGKKEEERVPRTCPNGHAVAQDWITCPYCGVGLRNKAISSDLSPMLHSGSDARASESELSSLLHFKGMQNEYRTFSLEPFREGRISSIFLAEDVKSGEQVALKVFRSGFQEADALRHFYHELRAVKGLEHPSILKILDYSDGRLKNRKIFIAMPLVDGGNLRDAVMLGRDYVAPSLVIPILGQVALAIDYAHLNGIIHGDIKPENILLNAQQHAYLADFGLARHFDTTDLVRRTTVVPVGQGTSNYLSPEQLQYNKQSTKSDLYSFGLVAYEMLVGQLPFDSSDSLYNKIDARVKGNLQDACLINPRLPKSMGVALRRILDPEPKMRQASASAFVSELGGLQKWDVFIAHSSQDTETAEQLYAMLWTKHRVFLDTRCLRLGDSWDTSIQRAQQSSSVTVIIVSTATDDAYYARDEIRAAISDSRQQSASHRIVPLFKDAYSADRPPYGLGLKHGIRLYETNGIESAARRISDLVVEISGE